ncbi:MAG: dTMP kinase [Gammaproteobacteria bacterium]|nr:dTMP kinase [Gammaproteobacteria bacterium]
MSIGHYVALEGIEGAGKSTVAALLADRLREIGHDVVIVREPGGTPIGEGIRSVLLHGDDMADWTEALLFAAQRAQLAEDVIAPALATGSWVIGDRSVYSSLAYQGGARRLGFDEVRAVNQAGLQGVWPDTVVLLRLSPRVGLARQDGGDRIGNQGFEFQSRVADAYEQLACDEPMRFLTVDASRPVERVADDVMRALRDRWLF